MVEHRVEALVRSSTSATDATSFSATLHADITTDGNVVTEDGSVAFRAPSTTDLKLTLLGQQLEFLAMPPDEYISVPEKGWYNLGDAIVNRDAYAQYARNRGPVDYAGIVGALKNAQQLPDEEIDGITYSHYSGTFDLNDAVGKVPQDVFKPGVMNIVKQLASQPGTFDVWLDASTTLPRRLKMQMDVTVGESTTTTSLVMDYTRWNEPVDIPPVPQDAKPYSELTGGLTPADLSYELQFSSWLLTLAKLLSSVASLPDPSKASLTAEQRATDEAFLNDVNQDLAALQALQPTERFQPSYDKYLAGMQSFKTASDELAKELHQRGSGSEQKLTQAAEHAVSLFDEGHKLLTSEAPAKK